MFRIYIDRKAISDNRVARVNAIKSTGSDKGAELHPPIILDDNGVRTFYNQVHFPGGVVTYQPKPLNPDSTPVDPESPELWIEVESVNIKHLDDF